MNATLPHAPRALVAAMAALALALAVLLVAPAIVGDLDARLEGHAPQASSVESTAVPPATWARTPLATPIDTLRRAP